MALVPHSERFAKLATSSANRLVFFQTCKENCNAKT
jgi:hypothetical protein